MRQFYLQLFNISVLRNFRNLEDLSELSDNSRESEYSEQEQDSKINITNEKLDAKKLPKKFILKELSVVLECLNESCNSSLPKYESDNSVDR